MSKTIVLAVDTARHELSEHVAAAVEMTKDVANPGDKVIVLHVHEFAVGRFGRMQVDCADGQGESLVGSIVEDLSGAGLSAEALIRDADLGYVARAILTAAAECQARLLVLGSSSRTDLPLISFGSVASRLLHIASIPVLIVPMHRPVIPGVPSEPAGRTAATGPASIGAQAAGK
jgi:nucleotide-binding universal stress UspA family protein